MSDDSKQSEKIISELVRDPGQKIAELKSSARRQILDNLVSLLDQAYRKSRAKKKTDSREKQKWFTIFGYLAQVSTRIVRDLEYENLRSELDELKRQVLPNDVRSLRGAVPSQRHGSRDESQGQSDSQIDSH